MRATKTFYFWPNGSWLFAAEYVERLHGMLGAYRVASIPFYRDVVAENEGCADDPSDADFEAAIVSGYVAEETGHTPYRLCFSDQIPFGSQWIASLV